MLGSVGCSILGRRVRTQAAEVDLVARRGHELLCVEVKTSTDIGGQALFEPGNRFRFEHQRRQWIAAGAIARALHHQGAVRLMVCEVWVDARGRVTRWRCARCADGAASNPRPLR